MSQTADIETADRPQFDLFISYASEDRQLKVAGKEVSLLRELKHQLEAHHVPGHGRFRVCSYEEDFDLSDTVLSAIRNKIHDAQAGLVLCSSAAASSDYVHRELEMFQEEGRELIPAQVNLLPEDAFPEVFPKGTLAANLQPEPGASIREWKRQIENESHKIVARASGLEQTDVHDRFRAQKTKRRRLLFAAGVATLLVVGLAAWQSHQNLARQRHNEATDALEAGGFAVTAAEAGREVYDLRFEPEEGSRLARKHQSKAFVDSVTDLLAQADDLIQVRRVEIRQVPLGDAALAYLGALKELEELFIEQSVITDAGLAHLSGLRRLVRLDLQDTKLTDAGLGQLAQLTGLRSLTLGSTLVTDKGREELGRSLPECEMTLAPHEIAIRKVRDSLKSFGVTADHRDGSGFHVTGVAEDSPAAFGRVDSGAVITGINGEPVLRRSEVIPVSQKLRELQCSLKLDGQDEPLVLASTVAGFEVFRRHPDYDHDRFGTMPSDIFLEFRAFVSSFDGPDDDDGDGLPDIRATPEWVASEIKRDSGEAVAEATSRLRRFATDDLLHRMKLAPSPNSYGRQGFDRGHLYSPRHARQLGEHAVVGTGYVVNLAPQTPNLNRYTWNTLERLTIGWLESYDVLWVVAGPVYYDGTSIDYLENEGEVPIALPHAFFKILIREENGGLHVLPFLFPQEVRRILKPEELAPYMTSVDVIEALTGLDFFTRLSEGASRGLEQQVPAGLWPTTPAR